MIFSIKVLKPTTQCYAAGFSGQNFENEEVSLKDLAYNKKIRCSIFGRQNKRHFINVNKHITSLEEKYPHYNFVGINLRTNFTQWKQLMDEYKLDKNKQFLEKTLKNYKWQ